MEVVVTAGSISRAKLQPNHHHQQVHLITQHVKFHHIRCKSHRCRAYMGPPTAVHGVTTLLCGGYSCDSSSTRRAFDCLSKVIKCTVTPAADPLASDTLTYLLRPQRSSRNVGRRMVVARSNASPSEYCTTATTRLQKRTGPLTVINSKSSRRWATIQISVLFLFCFTNNCMSPLKRAVRGPPQYVPAPCKLTFWHWKWCPSHLWRGLSLCRF